MALTQIADVIVPQIFTPYTQQMTEEKTRIIRAGVLVRDAFMDDLLAGGGLTFQVPSWKDLANDADNVSTDAAVGGGDSTPNKIGTSQETAVRLSRNQSWSSADLTSALAGADPQSAIASRVSDYWARRLQAAFVATMTGVFNDNEAAPSGSEHVQNDLTVDISGVGFVDGVTNFSAEAFIDACTTLGDSAPDVTLVMVHSLVYARMQKNNLIDFIPDSQANIGFGTFLGKSVIVDDGVPFSGSVFESWIFGPGALCRFGQGADRGLPLPARRQRWRSGSPAQPCRVVDPPGRSQVRRHGCIRRSQQCELGEQPRPR